MPAAKAVTSQLIDAWLLLGFLSARRLESSSLFRQFRSYRLPSHAKLRRL